MAFSHGKRNASTASMSGQSPSKKARALVMHDCSFFFLILKVFLVSCPCVKESQDEDNPEIDSHASILQGTCLIHSLLHYTNSCSRLGECDSHQHFSPDQKTR